MVAAKADTRRANLLTLRTQKILRPGQPGTKKLVRVYGDSLVCVRYRYDARKRRKIKTIELVIEDLPWQPNPQKIPSNKILGVRVDYEEKELRDLVKSCGGKWNGKRRAWELPLVQIKKLGLTSRIIDSCDDRSLA